MKTIVIGLGNPLLGDDGVGWRVVKVVEHRYAEIEHSFRTVDFEYLSIGGLGLMEHMVGYDQAILIDAINSGKPHTGEISILPLEDIPENAIGHTTSAHDTSLMTAIIVGKKYGAKLPDRITIIGIEARQVYEFTEELSPAVSEAIPKAVQAVLDLLTH